MSPALWLSLLTAGGALSGFWLVQQPHSIWALLGVLGVLSGGMHNRGRRWVRWTIALSLLLIAIPLAALENTFLFELLTQIGIFAAMALGLNVVVGMACSSISATRPSLPWAPTRGPSLVPARPRNL